MLRLIQWIVYSLKVDSMGPPDGGPNHLLFGIVAAKE
jgi:hypothetical protein